MLRRVPWAFALGLVILAALLVRSVFSVPYLPTNDGPEHVFASHVENHYGDPGTEYVDRLKPAAEYASRGFTFLYTPLEEWLGWRLGLQVALALMTLGSALGFLALTRAVHPGRWPVAFLGFPLALTWELYMGFFPFAVGSAVGLFVLALAVRWRDPDIIRRVVVAFLLLLQAVCHVFTAVLTGTVVAVLWVSRVRPPEPSERPRFARVREAARVAVMGLPAASVLIASVLHGKGLTQMPFSENFLILPWPVTLATFPRLVEPGPWWRAVVAVLALGAAIVAGAARLARGDGNATDRSLFVAGAGLILLGLVMPMNVPGWQLFSPRFLPLGVLLCVVTVPVERLDRFHHGLGIALAAVSFLLSAASLALSSTFHARLLASCRDAVAGLEAPVRRRGIWLPITLNPQGTLPYDPRESEVPFLAPLRHLPMLYAVVEGGITPTTFANSAATYSFVIRTDGPRSPPIPSTELYAPQIESDAFDVDPEFRRRVENELATFGMFYEGILVTSAQPPDMATFRTRGFVEDWSLGSVLVAHFVPCTLDLVVPRTVAPLIDVGVGSQTILRDERPAERASERGSERDSEEGSKHLALSNAPCGEVWVRPHWDRSDSPSPGGSSARTYCANAGKNGEITTTLGRLPSSVVCR